MQCIFNIKVGGKNIGDIFVDYDKNNNPVFRGIKYSEWAAERYSRSDLSLIVYELIGDIAKNIKPSQKNIDNFMKHAEQI